MSRNLYSSKKKSKRKLIRRYSKLNENENTKQNLCDATQAARRGTFTELNTYIKKEGRLHVNDLSIHFKKLEKEEQIKPKVSRRRQIKTRAEFKKIENRKTTEKNQ